MDRRSSAGKNRDGLQPKPAPGSLALVQGFVNTRNIMRGYDLLEDVEGAVAWLVEHGLLDGGARLTEGELGHLVGFRGGRRGVRWAPKGGGGGGGLAGRARSAGRGRAADRGGAGPSRRVSGGAAGSAPVPQRGEGGR